MIMHTLLAMSAHWIRSCLRPAVSMTGARESISRCTTINLVSLNYTVIFPPIGRVAGDFRMAPEHSKFVIKRNGYFFFI